MLNRNEISELQSKYFLSEQQIKVLQKIQDDEVSRTYFFQNKKDLFWFEPLRYLGFFDPGVYQPKPKILETGSTVLINWDLLFYFDNMTQTQEFADNKSVQEEIINFIMKVSEYNIINNLHNSYTYYFFIKFLSRINKSLISLQIINLISVWINQTQSDLLITSEITQNLLRKFIFENCSIEDVLFGERILQILLVIKEKNQVKPYYSGYVSYDFISDHYWINELFKDKDFIKYLSEKFTFSFYTFLKSEMKKTLTVNRNVYTIECKDGMLEVYMSVNQNDLNFKIYLISNVTPNERRFDFINDVVRDKILLSEFTSTIISKEETINSLYNNFINISCNVDQKEQIMKNLSYSIYSSIFSRKTYDSLYNDSDDNNYDALESLNRILKTLLLAKSNSGRIENYELSKIVLDDLLNDNYFYFKKLFLYIVAQSTRDYTDIFWNNIQKESINKEIFEGLFFGDELRYFFERLINLNQHQIKQLEMYFERGPELRELDEIYILQWKQRLYAALKHIPEFKTKYEEYYDKTKIEYVLTPAIGPITSLIYDDENTGNSPLTDDELLTMKSTEIVEVGNNLDSKKSQENIKSLNGLLQSLRRLIIQKPEKFFLDLNPFLKSPLSMISTIFLAFQDLNRNNNNFQIGGFNEFIKSYLKLYNWKEELGKDSLRRNISPSSIFYEIYSSIRDLMRNRSIELDIKSLEEIRVILLTLLEYRAQLKGEIVNLESEDFLTITINSPIGNIIEAYILCIRNITLNADKEKIVKWKNEDREIFGDLLKEEVVQMYSMFGFHVNLFIWFNKEWSYIILENSNKLIEKEKLVLWKAFINGYMWNGRVFIDLYKLMHKNYTSLLDVHINDNEHSINNLIIHLSVGYLNELEKLNYGLYSKILDNKNYLLKVINYFWGLRENIIFDNYPLEIEFYKRSFDQRNKVLKFWEYIYDKYENMAESDLSSQDKDILSGLSRLTYYLFEINEKNYEWINQIVPYVYLSYNNTYFIEALNGLKEKGDSKFVADKLAVIYINLLKYSDTPQITTYKKENIFSIIKFINEQGFKENVKEILNLYVEKKYFDFAKEIRENIEN